ncbi:LysR family transcriptional regulator [Bacterioplanoides sp.]|uniref:LysR family transcriptional regulator n=1 Tax=Bacterioplanoides sp. TaxID=2066072 RepID=UPI003B5C0C3B
MYNLEQLRMFVETVDQGSFSACARQLGKAQSAVSQGIANLEIDLNTQLFDRSTRKPGLTDSGQRLLSHARAVLQQSYEFQATAAAIQRQEESSITLLVDDSLFAPQLSKLLLDFAEQFPATRMQVNSVSAMDIGELLVNQQGDIGLGFVDLDFNFQLDLCFIGNLPFLPVCHHQLDLAKCEEIHPQHLTSHRQILFSGQSSRSNPHVPQISAKAWSCNSFYNGLALIRQGLGWSYLPQHLVQADIDSGELVALNFAFDYKTWAPAIDILTPKNQVRGPALSWLYQQLKDVF